MRDFRKQRGRSKDVGRFFVLCAGLAGVLALALFSAQAAWGMYVKFTVASKGDEAAQGDLESLQAQYTRVTAAVDDFSTARGQEGEIRERFGVSKPGEGSIEIVRAATSSEGQQNTLPQDLWHRMLRAFVVW